MSVGRAASCQMDLQGENGLAILCWMAGGGHNVGRHQVGMTMGDVLLGGMSVHYEQRVDHAASIRRLQRYPLVAVISVGIHGPNLPLSSAPEIWHVDSQ